MSGLKLGDLGGGGAFRWYIRLIVLGSLLIVLGLRLLLGVNVFLAVLAGSTLFLLGLLVLWLLLITGRVKVKY